jgi:hypothetical protein
MPCYLCLSAALTESQEASLPWPSYRTTKGLLLQYVFVDLPPYHLLLLVTGKVSLLHVFFAKIVSLLNVLAAEKASIYERCKFVSLNKKYVFSCYGKAVN